MTNTQIQVEWEKGAREKFQNIIKRIPLFHREIAQQVVEKKAVENARARGAGMVEEADISKAFFSEVPKAFYSLMVRLLDECGFDYRECEPK